MDDCIFCKIVKGEIPASVILESDNVVAFKNIAPAAEHHILVVPKLHIENFMSIGSGDTNILSEMIEVAQAVIKKLKSDEGYKLIFNGGKFQAVNHLHWHLLGGEIDDLSKT